MQAILSIPKPYNPALNMQHLPTFWFGDVSFENVPINLKYLGTPGALFMDCHGLSVSNA